MFIVLFLMMGSAMGWLIGTMGMPKNIVILIEIIIGGCGMVILICEYHRRAGFYKKIYRDLNLLDKKYQISAMMDEPDFVEGKLIYDVIQESVKSMNDEIGKLNVDCEEYSDYIEAWVHQIKMPIAVISLICENNKNEITTNILNELKSVEMYVEQALYYARSNVVEKDYLISALDLEKIVKDVIKKEAKELISASAKINFKGIKGDVYADRKWIEFILRQILSNSIKYRDQNRDMELTYEMINKPDCSELIISDNGIGVDESDLGRVFEKGFTGKNGRIYGKSTGIGLYLCKKMCNKMYIGIEIYSQKGVGTQVVLTFPKDSRILLADGK